MSSIYPDIIESIKNNVLDKEDKINALLDNGKRAEIDKANFHTISKSDKNAKLVFIDGGNAELLKGINFSLQYIRVCAVCFKNNKRIFFDKNEFYVLVHAFAEDDVIKYKADIFSEKEKLVDINDLVFDSYDKTIREGENSAEISKIGEICRRFAELSFAIKIANKLDELDIIVLDGGLKTVVTNENKYMQRLFDRGKEKNVFITALAKTSRLFTQRGNSLIAQINQIDSDDSWYYLFGDIGYANLAFVKLNKNSEFIFGFEEHKEQGSIKEIIELLAANSNDAVFPGYPYGLIMVDRFARISSKEKEHLITLFQAKAGKIWEKIKKYAVKDCHSILDSIS